MTTNPYLGPLPDLRDPDAVAAWREECAVYDTTTRVLRRTRHRAARLVLTAVTATALAYSLGAVFLPAYGVSLVAARTRAPGQPVAVVERFRLPIDGLGLSLAQLMVGVAVCAAMVAGLYRDVITSRVRRGTIAVAATPATGGCAAIAPGTIQGSGGSGSATGHDSPIGGSGAGTLGAGGAA